MNKIKQVFVIFVISLLIPSLAFGEMFFKDVPKNHWAYDAINELCERGIVEGYDGKATRFYKGDKPLTRYEFAQALVKTIHKLEAEIGVSRPDGAIDDSVINDTLSRSNLNEKDVVLLRKLIDEFKKEIADINLRVSELERKQREAELRNYDKTPFYLSVDASIVSVLALLIAVFK